MNFGPQLLPGLRFFISSTMAKDPAFLFYSKDWLQGTASMTKDEKGVYIDLLAHQHQDDDLPCDTKRLSRMVGLSEQDFLPIWEGIKTKFKPANDNRLVNRKLTGITTERSTKGLKNTITGYFASIIRLSNISDEKKAEVKKSFKIDDFITVPKENLTECLTEWFHGRLKSIGNGNANGDGNANTNGSGFGKSENLYAPKLISQMHDLWKTSFPHYTENIQNDYPACREIAEFIFMTAGVKSGFGNTDAEIKVLNTFQAIADQVSKDHFWANKPLKTISKNIQEFYNKIKNPGNGSGKGKSKQPVSIDESRAALNAALIKRHGKVEQNGNESNS
jgi:hypothetical protein